MYKKNGNVNYCNSCETVLVNEQVIDDHCERCGSKIETKTMNQWYFKISDYPAWGVEWDHRFCK